MVEVQIIGTQRSGSNLLRLMLNQLKGVFAPHPPHIMGTFYPLLKYYGNLKSDNRFRTLIDDVCRLVELNPVPWEPLRTDRDLIFESCKVRTLTEVFRNIYGINAMSRGAGHWVCKSMQNVHYLTLFEESGFKPKLIYLYRDGRDVALSFKNALVGSKHIYPLARKWMIEQELSIDYLKHCEPGRAFLISYESLLMQPESEMKRLCAFLGLDYDTRIFEFYDSAESIRTADSGKMWSNLKKPIIPRNFGKYKKGLSTWEIELFEQIAGNTLKKLGYELSADESRLKNKFSRNDIEAFKKEDALMIRKTLENADPRDLFRRKRQEQFVQSLKERWQIDFL